MDPFSKLPSLVQTEIFVQLRSDTSIKQITRASPSMLWHFVTFRKSIIRRIINHIAPPTTSGDIIRDALRIIDISDNAAAERYKDTDLSRKAKAPDNLTDDQLRRLWRLFVRMIHFIEDYISKATSVYPPRAYMGIPDVIDGSGSYFQGQRLETNAVRFTTLTSAERHRFLSAFMRHELLCKIFYPRDRYLGEEIAMGRPLAKMCQEADWEILLSVHAYYTAVYGALFAHGASSWFPGIPEQCQRGEPPQSSVPTEYGLLFPDNIFLNAREYEKDLDTNNQVLAYVLPCFGLDCLTQILLYVRKAVWHEFILKTWLRTLPFATWYDWSLWTEELPNSLTETEFTSYDRPRTDQPRRGYNGINWDRGITFRPGNQRHEWVKDVQLAAYRQRAWGLFDDDRLYPKHTNHFPPFHELYRMQTEFEEMGSRAKL
ncbi:hypothetical protein FVEG_16835 [Fusarium verticillioides 7600]|uniref:Uncharacterized protein n=1 Tax=Gibberella moniliformis (strain M3125 / FGSC 7600) TaxID=334819 RepID=W7N4W7_GIBM7|nr:hypothetical protein FVEG_16835 [Fusarium verticillioides 7600]EWG51682.1 hypothetical protein FVEG_16835 [Fusarium verticillioides 7600]